MSQFANLMLEEQGDVLLVRMNRPEQANAFDYGLAEDLCGLANRLGTTWKPRAILLTGEGRFFSAGGDVKSMADALDGGPGGLANLLRDLTRLLNSAFGRMLAHGVPLIAAVDGPAAGAGFSVACACDMVVASPKASFLAAYTGIGFTPDIGLTYHLPRLVGQRKAWELIALNRKVNAEQALEMGLVTELYEGDQPLVDYALSVAQKVADQPAHALRTLRRLLVSSDHNSFEAQVELEAQLLAEVSEGAEGREGVRAFLEGRKPNFRAP